MVEMKTVPYMGLPNCRQLSNGTVDVIVTTDVGPRVIAYRFSGGRNMLAEFGTSREEKTELGAWHSFGGHRLWYAPEIRPRCFSPDNDPVAVYDTTPGTIHLVQNVEQKTFIAKEMIVSLDERGTHVTVTHKITNRGMWPIELAAWAITVMAPGGVCVFPNEPFRPHTEACYPSGPIVLWYYSDLSDPRLTFGKTFVRLRNDEKNMEPEKIGAMVRLGWAGYLRGTEFFLKRFPHIEGAPYADYGCNFETYTKGNFLEVESLAPMVKLEPGQSTVHVEDWYLHDGVKFGKSDVGLDEVVAPLLAKSPATPDTGL